jgi:transposase
MMKKDAAFFKEDVVAMVNSIREHVDPSRKIAIYWDNASIHTSPFVTDQFKDRNDIAFVRTVTYRPDLNGIEFFWAVAKCHWYKKLDWHKATRTQFDMMKLVGECIDLSSNHACKSAKRGWRNMRAAVAIEPQQYEVVMH